MALNLNKGGEENSKTGFNLNKKETVSNETTFSDSETNEIGQKKRNPIIFIFLAVLVVGGIFWFLNKDATTLEQTSINKGDSAVSTAPDQTEQTTSSENTTNKQEKDNTVNSSTTTGSDTSVSSSQESNVSATSNNISNSNNVESSKSTPSKNQSTSRTSAASAITSVGSIDEKVNQVLRGDFGNGLDRKRALGDEYAVIQAKVNEILKLK
jgi:cytoskeletal protein RodZ